MTRNLKKTMTCCTLGSGSKHFSGFGMIQATSKREIMDVSRRNNRSGSELSGGYPLVNIQKAIENGDL